MRVAVHAGQLLQPVPGGIGRYVRSLLDALPSAGVTPVPFAAGSLPGAVDLGWPRGGLRYEAWHRLRRPVVRVEGDLVHATSLAVPPARGRPLVVTVHDLVFLRQPEHLTARGVAFHRRGLALARRDAAAIVVPTAFGRDDLVREGFAADRIHVAPHGVAPAVPSGLAPPVDGDYLLFVSTIEPRKGVNDLLDAHQIVRGAHPDLQLVLAGPRGWGEPPDTDRPGVVVVGNLTDAALDAAYRGAVALVVPERYAGFGLPVIEGMARGCPVVTSDAACLPEVGGGAAVVVPTGDVGTLADALDELVRSSDRRAALSAAGLAHSAAYTWERSAALHRAAYEAALA
ncbi:MAG TPA: glycosyltransferase family 1 protein [Acidimicrobiales bacterium]|nr:glycosyltransferase family 1 protein [Acidimicrobiales bacterium]